jgi:hypothetical protein
MLVLYDHVITLDKEVRFSPLALMLMTLMTFCMIRSSGSGRLSIVIITSGYALTPSGRLRWGLPKIIFLINRYLITSLILYVMTTNILHMHENDMIG